MPLGPTPSGYAVFDQTGHVFVQVTHPPATHDSSGAAASAAAFTGFFGTFEADAAAPPQLRIQVEGSNYAPYIGTTQLREFRVTQETLVAGLPGQYELRFVRLSERR
jgi:hypothetical protein